MLNINNIQFERHEQSLFKPLNAEICPGTCFQLCGSNGVGKTTILKILAGLIKARRGSLLLHQKKIPSLAKFCKYLGHELGLKIQLTLQENLNYYAAIMQANPCEISLACDFFDLHDLLPQKIESLSAGQKHRAQLAKLFIQRTKFWLLDEPFTGLDSYHAAQLITLFKIFTQDGGTIIFTSHHSLDSTELDIQQYLVEATST